MFVKSVKLLFFKENDAISISQALLLLLLLAFLALSQTNCHSRSEMKSYTFVYTTTIYGPVVNRQTIELCSCGSTDRRKSSIDSSNVVNKKH